MAQESKEMSRQLTKPRATERDDPRRAFETAITQLQQTKPLLLSQQQIFTRRHAVLFSEKQALSDAARALARLWNVSSVPIR
jgi:hypothetical protein